MGFKEIKAGSDLSPFYVLCLRSMLLSALEARVGYQIGLGSYTIFIGETTGSEVLRGGQPMTYLFFHEIPREKVPTDRSDFPAGESIAGDLERHSGVLET